MTNFLLSMRANFLEATSNEPFLPCIDLFLWIFATGRRINIQNYPTIMAYHFFDENNQFGVAFRCYFKDFAEFIGHLVH